MVITMRTAQNSTAAKGLRKKILDSMDVKSMPTAKAIAKVNIDIPSARL
jgi:hypothetical protein